MQEMFGCTRLNRDEIKKVENNGLEGENMFIFMYESNSGDIGLNDGPTNHSCIDVKYE